MVESVSGNLLQNISIDFLFFYPYRRVETGAIRYPRAVMIGGILPWAFSPLLFHNEMSVLLIFLMGTNIIAGVMILPSFIAWRRPRFIAQFEHAAAPSAVAAGAGS